MSEKYVYWKGGIFSPPSEELLEDTPSRSLKEHMEHEKDTPREILLLRYLLVIVERSQLSLPTGLTNNLPWLEAIYAHDFGDSSRLNAMLLNEEKTPQNVCIVVAEIISGNRAPNPKKISQVKIKGLPRFELAFLSWCASDSRKIITKNSTWLGDEGGEEAVEVIELSNRVLRNIKIMLADTHDVSAELIEDLRREFQERVDKWPLL